jgi:hypothetical protein
VHPAGAGENVDATFLGGLERGGSPLDVELVGAGQGADHRPLHLLGDPRNALELAGPVHRKTRFDDVDVKAGQGVGDLELLLQGKGYARGLLPVPKRGVENPDVAHENLPMSYAIGLTKSLGRTT